MKHWLAMWLGGREEGRDENLERFKSGWLKAAVTRRGPRDVEVE